MVSLGGDSDLSVITGTQKPRQEWGSQETVRPTVFESGSVALGRPSRIQEPFEEMACVLPESQPAAASGAWERREPPRPP